MVQAAFALPPPDDATTPVYGDYIDPDGDYVIIALDEVRDGNFAALPEAVRKQTRDNLGQVMGMEEMDAIMAGLKAQAVIQIPEQTEQE
jgi:hypothetical protein